MSDYTVQIQASNAAGDIWQPMRPAETIRDVTDSPEKLARDVAATEIASDDGNWRIVVWSGADADITVAPVHVYTATPIG